MGGKIPTDLGGSFTLGGMMGEGFPNKGVTVGTANVGEEREGRGEGYGYATKEVKVG